ncbi:MAG: hypothetical protein DRH93_19435 [Deltaproteobacteria bacterium]|nr:MAG: hypothetical protein DRH93_19435 [Deltaproteobacteria bacterium]
MKKSIWMILILVMIFPLSGTSAMESVMWISNQKMTLKVDGMPLKIILREFSRAGIKIKLDPEVNPYITADFKNKEIQKAFETLAKGYSHALVWGKTADGVSELSEVIIFKPGKINRAVSLKSSENLKIEKNPETGAIYVKNKILIQFKKTVSGNRIKAVLSKLRASLRLINKDLAIYEITLPENGDMQKALAALKKEDNIASLEPDYAYRTSSTFRYDYGETADTISTESLAAKHSVPVAILDTGLMPQYLSDSLNQASFDALSADNIIISDAVGHGTQMALIASGQVHPMGSDSATFSNPVISIRAFDDNGYTSNAVLIKSIDFAIKNGARVLSLSWGSETDSRFLESAMNYAKARGLIVVAAAGNNPTGTPMYPAAYESVISVSALAPDGKAWEKSNYGDFVDIAAPGFAHLPVGYNGDPGTYAGTSISTAYIAGKLAAYLREHPEATGIDLFPE